MEIPLIHIPLTSLMRLGTNKGPLPIGMQTKHFTARMTWFKKWWLDPFFKGDFTIQQLHYVLGCGLLEQCPLIHSEVLLQSVAVYTHAFLWPHKIGLRNTTEGLHCSIKGHVPPLMNAEDNFDWGGGGDGLC